MLNKKHHVFGVYKDRNNLERAIDQLKAEGYSHSDISVMFPDSKETQEFAQEKHTKAPEGAATGAGTGMAIGGALGWLVGIGSLAIPGLGPLIAAGPIMAALAGAGAGGVVGTLTGALIGMGIPEYEAKKYEDAVKKGGYLLSVQSEQPELVHRGRHIFNTTNAEQVSGTGDYDLAGEQGLRTTKETQLESGQDLEIQPGEKVILGKDKIEKKRTA